MINKIRVPNEGPLDAKILFVGESPGEEEEQQRKPFVGMSGQLLMQCLGRAGISREEVRLANLSQFRPQGNKFEHLVDSKELREGTNEIYEYIRKHRPNVIVPLGAQALQALTGKTGIHVWRGSILESQVEKVKTISTFHPSAVLRDRSLLPIFDADIFRVASDSRFPELRLPQRRFVIDPRGLELEEWVQYLENCEEFSVDIESTRKGDRGTKHILCIGFAPVPDLAICIPNHGDNATSNAYSRILSSRARKVFQFGTFDVTALEQLNGYEVSNYSWDILTGQHILNAELPRGLDFLASIYTREPYYKATGRSTIPGDTKEWGSKVDRESLYIYNCRDAAVTIEIKLEQEKELTGRDREMFDYEMSLIPVALDMGRVGLPIDTERRKAFEVGLYQRWMKLQVLINQLCSRPINVSSPKQVKDLLYGEFKLPVKRNRNAGITADEDAIVSLIGNCVDHIAQLSRPDALRDWKVKLLVLKSILEIRGLRKLIGTYVKNPISQDDRARSIYKFSSTDTGRAACEMYIDGTGFNAQTIPRSSVEIPDDANELIMFDSALLDKIIAESADDEHE